MKASWKQTGLPRDPVKIGLGRWNVKWLIGGLLISLGAHYFVFPKAYFIATRHLASYRTLPGTSLDAWTIGAFALIGSILWMQRRWADRTEPLAWLSAALVLWVVQLLWRWDFKNLGASGLFQPDYLPTLLSRIGSELKLGTLLALLAGVQLFRHRARRGRWLLGWSLGAAAWTTLLVLIHGTPLLLPRGLELRDALLPLVVGAPRLHYERAVLWPTRRGCFLCGPALNRSIIEIGNRGTIADDAGHLQIHSPADFAWYAARGHDLGAYERPRYADGKKRGPFHSAAVKWANDMPELVHGDERPVSDRDIRIFASRLAPFSFVRLCVESLGSHEVAFWRFCFGVRRWDSGWDLLLSGDYNWGNDLYDSPYVGELRMDMEAFRTGKGPPANAAHLFVQRGGVEPIWTFDGVINAPADDLSQVWEASGKQVLLLDAADDVPWGDVVKLLVDAKVFEHMQFDVGKD